MKPIVAMNWYSTHSSALACEVVCSDRAKLLLFEVKWGKPGMQVKLNKMGIIMMPTSQGYPDD